MNLMTNSPKIYIKDAWLVRDFVSYNLHKMWANKGEKLADYDDMQAIVKSYNDAWKPKEKAIISGMCDVLDLTFAHNIIDVYIAPWFYAFSDPLIIGIKYCPDEFVDILHHELTHKLLSHNNKHDINNDEDEAKTYQLWRKMYGKQYDFSTLVHIPVHAVSKYIYLDVLNEPYRLERDIDNSQRKQLPELPYKEAWDYVEKHDYKKLINDLKKSYAKI